MNRSLLTGWPLIVPETGPASVDRTNDATVACAEPDKICHDFIAQACYSTSLFMTVDAVTLL